MAPTPAALLWGFPGCWSQAHCLLLPEIVLLAPGAPLAVAWSLAGRAPHYCVLPSGLVSAAAAVADVLLG